MTDLGAARWTLAQWPGARFFALALAALMICPLSPAAAAAALSELVVVTASGHHAFLVELADTPAERARGLMFRRALAANQGMLFDYGKTIDAAMWMKNTYIPLDILFIAADGRIVNIARDTTPESLATIASRGPVRAALELNAGTARRMAASAGDRIVHPLFETVE